ncbi:MAG: DUF5916 domain-containing protein, partial [Thermoanaerobaculia bacterium]|nr:DUF5916 domain-containing protein [Thermoanaerobaculia bacterium]
MVETRRLPVVRAVVLTALFVLPLAGVFGAPALAQQDAEPTPEAVSDAEPRALDLRVRRAAGPIEIDGVLDDPAWREAAEAPVRWEYLPGDATPAPVETEALVTFDREHLYVAFRAHDPEPQKIRANLMDRDSIGTFVQDDHVVFLVDTFNDERRAYQFRVNPLGVQADAFNSDVDQTEDWSFDLIWQSAGRIGADGYVVEIAVPIKQLRFPRVDGEMTWRMTFERSWPRSVRHRISESRRDRNRSCGICQFSTVTGFQELESGRNLEVDPTLTVTRTDRRADFPRGDLVDGGEELEPGITARWGLTPSLSLTATVNPDFSQVEADVAQLAVNERFALFFPEKRPFFLEGADVFNTPFNLVFTRTVASPDWGVKLTGKQGKSTIGIFATRDAVNNLLIPGNQGSRFAFVDDEVDTAVLRYRRDVGERSSVGFIYAGREGDGYHNRVAGIDGFFRLTQKDQLELHLVGTRTLYPLAVAQRFGQPTGSFDGEAFRIVYTHFSREWIWQLFYHERGPEFRADAGFEPRIDNKARIASLQRRFWGNDETWWDRVSLGLYLRSTDDFSGQLTDEDIEIWGDLSGPLQLYLNPSYTRSKRFFAGTLYEELDEVSLYGEIQPGGRLKATGFFNSAETIDFANNRPADQLLLQP